MAECRRDVAVLVALASGVGWLEAMGVMLCTLVWVACWCGIANPGLWELAVAVWRGGP
jgi:hypothetical protein